MWFQVKVGSWGTETFWNGGLRKLSGEHEKVVLGVAHTHTPLSTPPPPIEAQPPYTPWALQMNWFLKGVYRQLLVWASENVQYLVPPNLQSLFLTNLFKIIKLFSS